MSATKRPAVIVGTYHVPRSFIRRAISSVIIVPCSMDVTPPSTARFMTRAGAVAAPADSMDPSATLQIVSERWGNTPISIDQLGRAQEFSLRYAVMFTLVDAEGGEVVPRQVVELSRDYVAPPSDSRGQASERELLGDELRREMTSAILRRIGAALQVTRPDQRGAAADTGSAPAAAP